MNTFTDERRSTPPGLERIENLQVRGKTAVMSMRKNGQFLMNREMRRFFGEERWRFMFFADRRAGCLWICADENGDVYLRKEGRENDFAAARMYIIISEMFPDRVKKKQFPLRFELMKEECRVHDGRKYYRLDLQRHIAPLSGKVDR